MISKTNLLELLQLFEQNIGDKKSELNYKNPYTFAVAVLLSAQATDKSVNIATNKLFEIADTPTSMIALGESKLKVYIKTIGLFNTKAKHIIEMSKILVHDFNSVLPNTVNNLMKLPGIGRKSANVILNELYGTPTIGVDTHVLRLVHRLDLVPSSSITPLQVENDLNNIIPSKYKPFISNYLVLFGRYICRAKNPLCDNCYIKKFCKFKNNF